MGLTNREVVSRSAIYKLVLPKEVEQIWKEVERVTGKGFQLIRDSGIQVSATVRMAGVNDSHHIVRYLPDHEDELPYLLAHEGGHVLRFYEGPPESRKLPGITEAQRRAVEYELREHRLKLARYRLPEEATNRLMRLWHEGIVRQVSNIPVDMRIERWMFENYEGLGPFQRQALRRELKENARVLDSKVKAFTPKKVYDASNTMNAAFAAYQSRLLDDTNLTQPYLRTPYYPSGQRMAKSIWDSEDVGQPQDIETTNRWSEELGVSSWFEWVYREAEIEVGH